MRFERIRARGIGPWRQEVDIDFTSIPGQLVAITGPNGAGKSTLLELLAAALYRQCPTRGPLNGLARTRDAMLEVHAVNGQRHTIRHLIDGISGKSECAVMDESGTPRLESGKVREFDLWSRANLPAADVLYSGPFSPQGRRGMLDMTRSERAKVLNRAIGIERYERYHASASERRKVADAECSTLRARIADLPAVDIEAMEAARFAAAVTVLGCERDEISARKAMERAKAASADAERKRELFEQRDAAEKRLEAAEKELASIDLKIANNRRLLEQEAEIRASEAKRQELTDQSAAAIAEETRLRAEAERLAADEARARKAHVDAVRTQEECVRRINEYAQQLSEAEMVRQSVVKVPHVHAELDALRAQHEQAARDAELHQENLIEGQDTRLGVLREGIAYHAHAELALEEVQGGLVGLIEIDDCKKEILDRAPEMLAKAKARVAELARQIDETQERLRKVERIAAREQEMAFSSRLLEECEAELGKAEIIADDAGDARADASRATEAARRVTREQADVCEMQRARLAEIPNRADQLALLATAAARIEERSEQRIAIVAAIEAANRELAALPVVTLDRVDLSATEQAVAVADARLERARAARTRVQDALEQGSATLERRRQLEAELQAASDELADWTLLSQALGRDGIQALELDAAVPEINAIANDLLHNAHSARFTVELRTDRLTADGKRMVEDLEVNVLDTVEGHDGPADEYSGGELVIVGESIALALTVLACRRAGIERPTLIRDESGAALDGENGRAYIAMLRRAAQQIGADKCLFVSHSVELQELADARICISKDHEITIQGAT